MYATRRTSVKNWDHLSADERYSVQIARGGKPDSGIQSDRVSIVEEELMSWRKANHIHGWFVDNVMGGEDPNDGRSYYVDPDKLRELFNVCQKVIEASKLVSGMVLKSIQWNEKHGTWDELREPGKVIADPTVAQKLLPRRVGFFFGCYDYDEDYLDSVIKTRDWIARTLADDEAESLGELYYSSSW